LPRSPAHVDGRRGRFCRRAVPRRDEPDALRDARHDLRARPILRAADESDLASFDRQRQNEQMGKLYAQERVRTLGLDMKVSLVDFSLSGKKATRRRGREHERLEFATPYSVTLSPLPCWAHLSPEQQRARVTAISETSAGTPAASASALARGRGRRCGP
jgi:hypothetical protein